MTSDRMVKKTILMEIDIYRTSRKPKNRSENDIKGDLGIIKINNRTKNASRTEFNRRK
jgi:hypothetical protein